MRRSTKRILGATAAVALLVSACENPWWQDGNENGDAPPGAVSGLSGAPRDGAARLTWTDPSADDLAEVRITWTPEDGTAQPLTVAAETEEASVSGLTNGRSYEFSVVAVNEDGLSSSAETAVVTPVEPGSTAWSYSATAAVETRPAVAEDGTIYVSVDGRVSALGPDGSEEWSTPLAGSSFRSPIIAPEGHVYVASQDVLYKLSSEGTLLDSYNPDPPIAGTAAVASDGTVYLGTGDRFADADFRLIALTAEDLTVAWERADWDALPQDIAVAADGTVYAIRGTVLLALDPADGSSLWNWQADPDNPPSLFGLAIGEDGTIHVGDGAGRVYALSPAGNQVWTATDPFSAIDGSPVIGPAGNVYSAHAGTVYAFDGTDGSLQWSFGTDSLTQAAPTVGTDGTIYVPRTSGGGSSPAGVTAVNADGTERWARELSSDVEAALTVAPGGLVLAGTQAGELLALRSFVDGPADTPWPGYGGNLRNDSRAR